MSLYIRTATQSFQRAARVFGLLVIGALASHSVAGIACNPHPLPSPQLSNTSGDGSGECGQGGVGADTGTLYFLPVPNWFPGGIVTAVYAFDLYNGTWLNKEMFGDDPDEANNFHHTWVSNDPGYFPVSGTDECWDGPGYSACAQHP